MLALSSSHFSSIEFPLEYLIPTSHIDHDHDHQLNHIYRGNNTNYNNNDSGSAAESSFVHLLHDPSHQQQQLELQQSPPGDLTMVKKLRHNAGERDRRKKINTLYSSLQSLLPAVDQMKKLSKPETVSQVLKYIAELQQQVEGLIQKKEEVLARVSKQADEIYQERQRKSAVWSSLAAVSSSRLNDKEILLQISTFNVHEIPLSQILIDLEEDGLSLLNATSFESFGGRVFYSLHLQVDRIYALKSHLLGENFLSSYEKREELFAS